MVRRSTSYGPMLPDGVLEDDGIAAIAAREGVESWKGHSCDCC